MDICLVKVREIEAYLRKYQGMLVDLRSREAFWRDHIPGAVNVPEDTLERFLKGADRERLYILYCERGILSLKAARSLSRRGFRICALAGGMRAYREWIGSAD